MTHKTTIDGVPLELLQIIEMTWRQASGFSNTANDAIAKGLGELRALLADDGICPTCDSRGHGCPVCQPVPEPAAAHQNMRAAFEAAYPLQGEDAEMVTWCEKTGSYVSSPSRSPGFSYLAEYRTDLYLAWCRGARGAQPQGEPVTLPARKVPNGNMGQNDMAQCRGFNRCLDALAELGPLYRRPAEQGAPIPAAGPWIDGSPPKPWCSESFLAQTACGNKVVLSPLPEEYSYDFQTADGTHMMRGNITKWAQLSTSDFVDYDGKPEAEQPAPIASEPVTLGAVAVLRDDGDGGLKPEWLLEGGTAELVEGTLLLVADDQSLCAEDGHAELYRHAPGAEA